jgi:hypothetical protein
MSEKIRRQIAYEEERNAIFPQYPPGTLFPRFRACPWCRQEYFDTGAEEGAKGWELKEVPLPPDVPRQCGSGATVRSGLWKLICLKCGWVAEFKEW